MLHVTWPLNAPCLTYTYIYIYIRNYSKTNENKYGTGKYFIQHNINVYIYVIELLLSNAHNKTTKTQLIYTVMNMSRYS